jgi:hypothetical protein
MINLQPNLTIVMQGLKVKPTCIELVVRSIFTDALLDPLLIDDTLLNPLLIRTEDLKFNHIVSSHMNR